MKRTSFLIVSLLVLTPFLVGAQGQPDRDGRNEWRNKMNEFREKVKEERQNLKDQRPTTTPSANPLKKPLIRPALGNRAVINSTEKLGIYVDSLLQRLEKQINNINNLISRTEKRAQEMSANGQDVTAVNTKLTEAKTALTGAKAELATVPAKLVEWRNTYLNTASTSASSTPARIKVAGMAKELVKSVISKMRDAHAKTVEAITMIKKFNNPNQ